MGIVLDIVPFLGLRHAYGQISSTIPAAYVVIVITFCLILAGYSCLHTKNGQELVPGVLVVGGSDKQSIKKNRLKFRLHAKELLQEGYEKSGGDFFYVPSPTGERLMIPQRYLDELKAAPVDHRDEDIVILTNKIFEGKYTNMGTRSTLIARVLKAQLNQHLDWTPVPVVDIMTKIVARVSSHMFGGSTLSHNQKWVDASINYTVDRFHSARKLKQFPRILRPLVARLLPEVRRISSYYATADEASIPLLRARRRTGEKAADLLYWLAETGQAEGLELEMVAGFLLKAGFAAIHTTGATVAQLVFDLCAHPEVIEPLRDELESVGGPDGQIDKSGFHKMAKMDSFMKESQRFNPLLTITFERVVHRPFPLSSGFVIPAHTTIGVPTQAITMDPSLYPDPDKFDALRFSKLRAADPEQEGRSQYVASNTSSMSFGYGRHACPGRFFVANEIKAILGFILREYDLRFTEGQSRPVSYRSHTQFLPDPTATVLFKRRAK
ncbi:hypothetical protein F66182_792 [Fusarium sp. NRRL 66182]|nr:hypothetical protein F66182_792 [Fusarium sp. NRRL 66182]